MGSQAVNALASRAYIKLAPASMSEREAKKIAAEYLRPMNQGLESLGSVTNFSNYVEDTYKPIVLPLMASSTKSRYVGIIKNYLEPTFGKLSLRDLTPLSIQRYFSSMAASTLSGESKDKIRDVLASILGSAVKYGLLVKNPCEAVHLPPEKRGKRRAKPFIYRPQFEAILELISEPYATAVFVAVLTGFRVSELAALKWGDVDPTNNKITIDERYSVWQLILAHLRKLTLAHCGSLLDQDGVGDAMCSGLKRSESPEHIECDRSACFLTPAFLHRAPEAVAVRAGLDDVRPVRDAIQQRLA